MKKKLGPQTKNRHLCTIEEFADMIGCTTRSLHAWIDKGMPSTKEKRTKQGRPRILIDPVMANDWIVSNGYGGFGEAKTPKITDPLVENPDSISDEPGLAGAVDRSRAAERHSFKLLRAAIQEGNNLSVRATLENWKEAAKTLSDLEKRLDVRSQLEKEIFEAVQQAVREWAEPIRQFVEAMPHAMASRCNPSDITHAETELRDWKDKQLLPLMSRPLRMASTEKPNGD